MSTQALGRPAVPRSGIRPALSSHWAWLAGGLGWAFLVPFVLADVLELQRDLFYGMYAVSVVALFALWARATQYDLVASLRRRLPWALGLGAGIGAVLAVVVLRTDDATARPEGIELVAAILWRGVIYGLADGLLLSVFPLLAVFAAFAGTRLQQRRGGKAVVGLVAILASLAMTAAYHVGYADFRSGKVTRPMSGDLVWSVPTLVTLNPLGAPIAHAGLHVTAVLHSYETDLYLPPHR